MKRNYLSIIETSKYLQKLLLYSYKLSIFVYIIIVIIIIISFLNHISVLTSFILLILNFIPIVSFLFGLSLYENTFTTNKISNDLITKLIISLALLFLPILIFIFNIYYPIDKIIKYLDKSIYDFFVLMLTIIFPLLLNQRNFNFYRDVEYIMKGGWLTSKNEIENKHLKNNFNSNRTTLYINKLAILAFQNTISCPKLDALECCKEINDNIPENFRVLDIGGGEGNFTFELLSNLKNNHKKNAKYICHIDPAPLKNEYEQLLKNNLNRKISINFSELKFENWEGTGESEFDLIIASHSLYGVFDNNRIEVPKLIKKLISFSKNKDSQIIVILSSKESRAYRFKEECLELIFGNKAIDFDARKFYEGSVELNFSKKTKTRIDNFIDLSDYINDYDNNNFGKLKLWLSYFLRVDFSKENDYFFHTLVEILKKYIQPIYELSEFQITKFKKIKSSFHGNSKVLTHKSEIFIFSIDNK